MYPSNTKNRNGKWKITIGMPQNQKIHTETPYAITNTTESFLIPVALVELKMN